MKTESGHSNLSTAVPTQALSAADKLAYSRQALQEALYPAAKEKKRTGGSTLRKLWPIRRSAAKAVSEEQETAGAQKKEERLVASRIPTGSERDKNSGHVPAAARVSGLVDNTGGLLVDMIRARWRKHPLHVALDIGAPVLEKQVRKRPLLWMIGAATVGAGVVLMHPWSWKKPQRLMRGRLGKEARVLLTSGLIVLATGTLNKVLARGKEDENA